MSGGTMRRDLLLRNPGLARNILIAGAAVHFLLCLPLYGRRGFPELAPFWLAMIWLWAPPVFLSAIYDKWSRRRAFQLMIYALFAGFVVSWGTVLVRPSNKGPVGAIIELTFFGPMLMVGVLVTEAVSRCILARIRKFPTHPYCERCGYLLHGLTRPRCPECGTSFPAEQLNSWYSPSATPLLRRWSTLLFGLAVLAGALFPFGYHAYRFRAVRQSAMENAALEWASGTAKWYMAESEFQASSPEQQERSLGMRDRRDPVTGLEIWYHPWHDWWYRVYQTSYREAIERKLRESGRSPPDFRSRATSGPSDGSDEPAG